MARRKSKPFRSSVLDIARGARAMEREEKIMEAVQAGVNQYIVKPFNATQLEEKIKEIFPG